MEKLVLHRFGGDPEFVFATVKEWQPYVLSAVNLLNTNKQHALSTFIGVDGHPATAEIRPRPANNVYGIILDCAAALVKCKEFCTRYTKMPLDLYAAPMVGPEPLGGHIHFSFFTKSLDAATLHNTYNATVTHKEGGIEVLDPTKPSGAGTSKILSMSQMLAKADANFDFPGLQSLHRICGFLSGAVEHWAPSATFRVQRFAKYGPSQGDPLRRFITKPKVKLGKCGGDPWAYFHWEYRVPSTWLNHPLHAYVQLAALKLSLLNAPMIASFYGKGLVAGMSTSGNAESVGKNYAIFESRLAQMSANGARFTKDVAGLSEKARLLFDSREEIMNPMAPINMDAWRKVLGG